MLSTSLALLLLCCVLESLINYGPSSFCALANWMFWKMLHAGLNNKETIKRLRGAGKDKEAMAIGNPANITQDICYPSNQGRQSAGTEQLEKKKNPHNEVLKGTGSARGSIVENIFMEGILFEGCAGWQPWPAGARLLGRQRSLKTGGRVRTLKSDIMTSVSGHCLLLTVRFRANDFTSLSIQLFICEMKNYHTCLIELW